jgi:hypothetical protein
MRVREQGLKLSDGDVNRRLPECVRENDALSTGS